MRIQNFGANLPPERLFFARVLMDIESRDLPDLNLRWTTNSGIRWNNEPVETLTAPMPMAQSELNFGIIRLDPTKDELNALIVYTESGVIKWHQKFEVDSNKVANTSFEIMKKFLTVAGKIPSERQGIELMYPAYGLEVPLNDELPGLKGHPKAARPLPDIKD
jgi:hypothetical protein